MIRKAGYPAEAHIVQTQDGYLLTLHRIPNNKYQPVLLQHGLLCSSADWVIADKDKGLGTTFNLKKSYASEKCQNKFSNFNVPKKFNMSNANYNTFRF